MHGERGFFFFTIVTVMRKKESGSVTVDEEEVGDLKREREFCCIFEKEQIVFCYIAVVIVMERKRESGSRFLL